MRTLLATLLIALSLCVQAVVIDTTAGRYEVSTVTGDYTQHRDQLRQQVWWGDESLAIEFLMLAEGFDGLGYPNTGFNESPYVAFAEGVGGVPPETFTAVYFTVTDGLPPGALSKREIDGACLPDSGFPCVWAVATKVPQPEADAGGPYSGMVGESVYFDGSASRDPTGGELVNYDWSFGDGEVGVGLRPVHTYSSSGTYTTTLTVTNENGETGTDRAEVSIVGAKLPPVADPGGPYNGVTSEPLLFNGSQSLDPDGGVLNAWDWDFGDGNTGGGEAPSHIYDVPGQYRVSLVVVDGEGERSSAVETTAVIVDASVPVVLDDVDDGGRCFIATAAWGSYLHPQVTVLRRFRDEVLLPSEVGRRFVGWYYQASPPLAQFIAEHDSLRLVTRVALTPLVYVALHPWLALFTVVVITLLLLGARRRL